MSGISLSFAWTHTNVMPLKQVPREARTPIAAKLTSILDELCCGFEDVSKRGSLSCVDFNFLRVPRRGAMKRSLASQVLTLLNDSDLLLMPFPQSFRRTCSETVKTFSKAFRSKCHISLRRVASMVLSDWPVLRIP